MVGCLALVAPLRVPAAAVQLLVLAAHEETNQLLVGAG